MATANFLGIRVYGSIARSRQVCIYWLWKHCLFCRDCLWRGKTSDEKYFDTPPEQQHVLRAVDRYAYTGCGSTAYCYPFCLGDEQILIHIRKPSRSRTYLVRIADPCSAEPVQLVPAQLSLSPAGPYQL